MLEITLKRSLIGSNPKQRATATALGLTKVNKVVTKQDNESTRGMIKIVSHLVQVQEVK